jgi:hypothetical protein
MHTKTEPFAAELGVLRKSEIVIPCLISRSKSNMFLNARHIVGVQFVRLQ